MESESRRPRALVVEDFANFRRVIVRTLALLDWDAGEVANGSELRLALEQGLPQVVILDWNLGEHTAEQELAQLKLLQVPVIIVTGDPDEVRGRELGVPVLAKPLEISQLKEQLQLVLQRRTAES
jgi:DNA-binding response OmpR family regulator